MKYKGGIAADSYPAKCFFLGVFKVKLLGRGPVLRSHRDSDGEWSGGQVSRGDLRAEVLIAHGCSARRIVTLPDQEGAELLAQTGGSPLKHVCDLVVILQLGQSLTW
jgi:hypothetical protein